MGDDLQQYLCGVRSGLRGNQTHHFSFLVSYATEVNEWEILGLHLLNCVCTG